MGLKIQLTLRGALVLQCCFGFGTCQCNIRINARTKHFPLVKGAQALLLIFFPPPTQHIHFKM